MIGDIKQACRAVCTELRTMPLTTQDLNKGRYKLLYLPNREVILVMFKRYHFRNFGYEFETNEGHGEGINKDDLYIAAAKGVNFIYVVYKEGCIYRIAVEDIIENPNIRTTKDEGKEMYCFSMKLLRRVC